MEFLEKLPVGRRAPLKSALRRTKLRPKVHFVMEASRRLRALVASGLLVAFLLALALAAAPQLHESFHRDATLPQHECAVTLLATGRCESTTAPIVFVVPRTVVLFEKIPALHPLASPAFFPGAALFEHAPPRVA